MDYRRTAAAPHTNAYSAHPGGAASHSSQPTALQPGAPNVSTNHSRGSNTVTLQSDGHPETERNNAFLASMFKQAKDGNLFAATVPNAGLNHIIEARVVVANRTNCVLTWAWDKEHTHLPPTLSYRDNILPYGISAKVATPSNPVGPVRLIPPRYPEVASQTEPHVASEHLQSQRFPSDASNYEGDLSRAIRKSRLSSNPQGEMASAGAGSSSAGPSSLSGLAVKPLIARPNSLKNLREATIKHARYKKRAKTSPQAEAYFNDGLNVLNQNEEKPKILGDDALAALAKYKSDAKVKQPYANAQKQYIGAAMRDGITNKQLTQNHIEQTAKDRGMSVDDLIAELNSGYERIKNKKAE